MADREFPLRPARRPLTEVLASSRPPTAEAAPYRPERSLFPILRFARYTAGRMAVLFLTVAAGLYLTLLAANLGGKLDEVVRHDIQWRAGQMVAQMPDFRSLTREERIQRTNELVAQMAEAAGLNTSIHIRVARFLPRGLMLDLGRSQSTTSLRLDPTSTAARNVRLIILERIPNTLLLLGVTNLVFFVTSVALGLALSRNYGSRLDRVIVLLSPTSAVPAWFYGIFLVAIFAAGLRLLPFSGMLPSPPPDSRELYVLEVLRHMILPFAAIFLSVFFYTVYLWRSFFLIHAHEDYVELARAKGLSKRLVERRYILRPTLPAIITNLAVMLLGIWSGSVILEQFFNWPGLGDLYYRAIVRTDTAVIVGLTVIYAYFLAVTIFVLDIAYAFLDPRVRLGSQGENARGQSRAWQPRRRLGQRYHRWLTSPAQRLQSIRPVTVLAAFLNALAHCLIEIPRMLAAAGRGLWQLRRLPSAVAGLAIVLLLLGSSLVTVWAIPYQEAIKWWRADEADWHEVPRLARPLWFNYFSRHKMPETIVMDSRQSEADKVVTAHDTVTEVSLTYTFDYSYDGFPQDLLIYFYPRYHEKVPHVTLTWLTPAGREIQVAQIMPRAGERHRFSDYSRLIRRLRNVPPQQGLFADPDADAIVPLKGQYQLRVDALLFEEPAEFDAKFIVHGQVYGWAGTDHRRRDLGIALLWGMPIALAFGLLAALCTTFLTMFLAAVGVWLGGAADSLIQRLAEVNMVLPVFPILAMFTSFFSLRIWEVLGLAILFGIFGSAIKTYRAIFLQVKASSYIEAAQTYGAGNLRIIFSYLLPPVLPVLVPQIVMLVPTYVFLEAGLAMFGISDIYLPTWGKVINEARLSGALVDGHYHWILQPAFLLLLTAFGFALLGFGLDRIFNPRLREV
jgi:peptide/nickel transport system permease protein